MYMYILSDCVCEAQECMYCKRINLLCVKGKAISILIHPSCVCKQPGAIH